MTIALRSAHGTAQTKTAATSHTFAVATASVLVGDAALFGCTSDNLATVDGNSNTHTSVTDTGGNTWVKVYEQTNTVGGAAGDGVTVSLWLCKNVTTQITLTTGSITVNFSGSIAAKVSGLISWSKAANTELVVAATNAANQDASTNGPTTVISGLASAHTLFFNVDGFESTQTSFALTQDVDYNNQWNNGTTGSTQATNQKLVGASRIATLTGDTHLATSGLTNDSAGILAAFREQSTAQTVSPGLITVSPIVYNPVVYKETVVPTLLDSGFTEFNQSVFNTSSITVGANELCIIAFMGIKNTTPLGSTPTVTCGSVTFGQVPPSPQQVSTGGAYERKLYVFRAMSPTGFSGAIQVAFSNTIQAFHYVVQKFNHVLSGTNGSTAILQVAGNNSPTATTAMSPGTLSAFGNINNSVFSAAGTNQIGNITHEVSPNLYDELGETSGSTIDARLSTGFLNKNDTTPTASSLVAGQWGMISLELAWSLVTSSQEVEPTFIDRTGTPFDPLVRRSQFVNPGLITQSGTPFSPSVSQVATPGLITSTGTVFAPTRIFQSSLTVPLISSTGTVFAPSLTVPAIVGTLLTQGADETDLTTYTTASITVGPNELCVIAVEAVRGASSPPDPTITVGSVTFTQVTNSPQVVTAASKSLFVYRAQTATGFSGAVSIAFSLTCQSAIWVVQKFSNVATGSNGGNAFLQHGVFASSGNTQSTTLAGFGSTDNATFMVDATNRGAGGLLTEEAGFTELGQQFGTTPTLRMATAWRVGADLSPTYTSDVSCSYAFMAFELKFSAVTLDQEVDPGLISSTGSTFTPTFTLGAITAPVGLISSVGATFTPTFTLGAISVSPGLLDYKYTIAGGLAFAPQVNQAASIGLINNPGVVFAPQKINQTVSVGLISSVGSVFAFTKLNQTVTLGLISSVGATFSPTFTLGNVNVSPGLLVYTGATFAPVRVFQSSVPIGLISSVGTVFTPSFATANSFNASDAATSAESAILVTTNSRSEAATSADTSALTAALVGSDPATASDTSAVTVPVTTTDTAAATDASTLVATNSRTEAGTSAETAAISLAASEAGASTDASTLAAILSRSEVATALDSAGIILVGADGGVTLESPTLAAVYVLTDPATAAETPRISLSATDAATAVETATVTVPVVGTDSGVSVETSVLTAAIPVTDAATAAEATASTAVLTATDAATGVDTASPIGNVPVSASDSGVTQESSALAASSVTTDTATSAEAVALTKPVSDAATATDTAALTAAISASDAATATDIAGKVMSVSDTGVTLETPALAAVLVGSDAATTAEASTLAIALVASDSGVGVDTSVPIGNVPVVASDSGSATENVTSPAGGVRIKGISDVITASDDATLTFAAAVSDAATATEVAALALTVSEAATAAEAAALRMTMADSGSGSESTLIEIRTTDTATGAEAVSVRPSASDTATSADASSLKVVISVSDSANTTESSALGGDVTNPIGSDAAVAAETAVVVATSSAADTATGTDNGTLLQLLVVVDSGTAFEQASRSAVITAFDTGTAIESVIVNTEDLKFAFDSGEAQDTYVLWGHGLAPEVELPARADLPIRLPACACATHLPANGFAMIHLPARFVEAEFEAHTGSPVVLAGRWG